MSKSLANKIGEGISPQQFMDGMTTNKDAFVSQYNEYAWSNEDDKAYFESLNFRDDLRCMILCSDWCGDVIRNIPVVFRAMETAGIPTEVLIKEQHPDVMSQFLTMGGEAIPIVIFTDTGGYVLGQWGPRPKDVQAVMVEFKKNNTDRNAPDYEGNLKAAYAEMGKHYGEGTGYYAAIISELRDLIADF